MSSITETPPGPASYAERVKLPPLPPEPPFSECLRVQLRVVGALLLRESLTRYGRHNIGFLWLFAEPMLFTLGVTAIWSLIGRDKGGGVGVAEFVLTGYSCLLLWRNMPNRAIGALAPNFSLLFHRQVKSIDVFLSRTILEAAGASISFVVLALVFTFFGIVRPPYDILTVIAGWVLLIWYAFSIALIVGVLSEKTEVVDKVWHIVQYLMIPLSGSFIMLQALPAEFRSVLLWIPTVSCIELVRAGYFGPVITAYYDLGYVVAFNSVALLFGLIMLRLLSRNLSPAV